MPLHTVLCETRLVLHDQSLLLMTLDQRSYHQKPQRDTDSSYAVRESADGATRQDLMALLSIPLLPDQAYAKQSREQAQNQRELAENTPPGSARERRLADAATDEWEAEQVLRFSREMPNQVFEIAPDTLILAYANDSSASRFRIVDIAQGSVLADFGGPEVDALVGGPQSFQRSASESAMLDQVRGQLGDLARFVPPSRGNLPSRVRLVAAGRQRALFSTGRRGYVLVDCSTPALRLVARLGMPTDWKIAVFCDQCCVVQVREEKFDLPVLLLVDAHTGAIERRIALTEHQQIVNASASASARRVAFGCFEGQALLLDLQKGTVRALRVNFGLEPHGSSDVSLSADGQWLAASTISPRQATLVDLRDDSYAYLNMPAWQRRDLRVGPRSPRIVRIPGVFAIDGGAEVLLGGRCTQVVASELHFLSARPALRSRAVPGTCRDLDTALAAQSLTGNAERIRSWMRPAVRLIVQRTAADTAVIGASKFGGMPDLLEGSAWPTYRRQPMAFLGQLNLADVARTAGATHTWPRKGLLSFFRAMDESSPMFYPEDHDTANALVLYAPDVEELERATKPRFGYTDGHFGTPPCALTLVRRWTDLPLADSVHLQFSGMDPEERENYLALAEAFVDDDEDNDQGLRGHYAGGYPRAMQNNEFERFSERIARGLDPYGSDVAEAPESVEIGSAATRWVQLLQLDTCNQTGWMWGDAGILHWMIPAEDLTAGRFDRVVVTGECA